MMHYVTEWFNNTQRGKITAVADAIDIVNHSTRRCYPSTAIDSESIALQTHTKLESTQLQRK